VQSSPGPPNPSPPGTRRSQEEDDAGVGHGVGQPQDAAAHDGVAQVEDGHPERRLPFELRTRDTTGRGCTSHNGSCPHPTTTAVPTLTLTSVKCICFFSAPWGRNSSISAAPDWFSSNLAAGGRGVRPKQSRGPPHLTVPRQRRLASPGQGAAGPKPPAPGSSRGPYLSPASEGTVEAVSAAVCFPLGTSSTISAWRGTSVVSMAASSLWALLGLCKRGATCVWLCAGCPAGPTPAGDAGVGLGTNAGGTAGPGTQGRRGCPAGHHRDWTSPVSLLAPAPTAPRGSPGDPVPSPDQPSHSPPRGAAPLPSAHGASPAPEPPSATPSHLRAPARSSQLSASVSPPEDRSRQAHGAVSEGSWGRGGEVGDPPATTVT